MGGGRPRCDLDEVSRVDEGRKGRVVIEDSIGSALPAPIMKKTTNLHWIRYASSHLRRDARLVPRSDAPFHLVINPESSGRGSLFDSSSHESVCGTAAGTPVSPVSKPAPPRRIALLPSRLSLGPCLCSLGRKGTTLWSTRTSISDVMPSPELPYHIFTSLDGKSHSYVRPAPFLEGSGGY